MKTMRVVILVVMLHCVIIGSVVLMQGCDRTTTVVARPSHGAIMPPMDADVTTGIIKPIHTAPPMMVMDMPGESETYVVRKGDTLSRIAKRYGVSTKAIMRANGIKNANRIFAKQRLTIPTGMPAPQESVSTHTPMSEAVSTEGMDVYTVAPGDCLSTIAVRCGSKVVTLRNANKLTSDRIFVGQKLLVPSSGMEIAPPAPVAEPEVVVLPTPRMPTPAPVDTVEDDPELDSFSELEADEYVEHEVQMGEDLATVARKYMVSSTRLMEFNNLTSDKIRPGNVLKIPQSE